MKWQPIETAPSDDPILFGKFHDGEWIWIASGMIDSDCCHDETWSYIWIDVNDSYGKYNENAGYKSPTHWSYIPEPPES